MRNTPLIFLFILLISCSKEEKSSKAYYYHDFVPDTVFLMPAVDDVTNIFMLQIGTDSAARIEITLRTASDYSAHMPVTEYYIWIASPDTSLKFIDQLMYPNGPCNPPLDSGTTISPADISTDSYLLYLEQYNWPEAPLGCSSFKPGGYIGFRFSRGGHTFMGWIWCKVKPNLSFVVDDLCYSVRPDTPMVVGIKE